MSSVTQSVAELGPEPAGLAAAAPLSHAAPPLFPQTPPGLIYPVCKPQDRFPIDIGGKSLNFSPRYPPRSLTVEQVTVVIHTVQVARVTLSVTH